MAEDDFTDKDYDANAPDLPAVPPKVPEAHLEKVFTLSIETIFTIKSFIMKQLNVHNIILTFFMFKAKKRVFGLGFRRGRGHSNI